MSANEAALTGKVCMVTGANSGIGRETALGLAKRGATVVLACRNRDAGQAAIDAIKQRTNAADLHLLALDLSSKQAIHDAAREFTTRFDRLDVLINNAAVIPLKRQETVDGFEMQFGVNHLGPFLLTYLLLDTITKSAPARIVNVASMMHYKAHLDFDDLQHTKAYKAMQVYAESKLANIYFTYELARRLEGTGVTVNCLHPGVVRTGIARNVPVVLQPFVKIAGLFMLSPEQGAATTLHVATAPELEGVTGRYFRECRESRSAPHTHDEAIAKRLWDISAGMVGIDAY